MQKYGQKFIIPNFSENKQLKMKFSAPDFRTENGRKSKILRIGNILQKYFYRTQHRDIDKFLLIRLQKSNYQGQKFIKLNFSEYNLLKMKFYIGKRQKIKDFKDEASFKNIFTEHSIKISTNFCSKGCKNLIIRDNNSLYLIFGENKVLKMKFQHGKRQKIKDFMDEISSKYIFSEYSNMILTNFYS